MAQGPAMPDAATPTKKSTRPCARFALLTVLLALSLAPLAHPAPAPTSSTTPAPTSTPRHAPSSNASFSGSSAPISDFDRLLDANRARLAESSTPSWLPLFVAAAIFLPCSAAVLGVLLALAPADTPGTDLALVAAALACGLVLRALLYIAMGWSAARFVADLPTHERARLRPSPLDWCRRLASDAVLAGFSTTFVTSARDSSSRGVGLAWSSHNARLEGLLSFLAGRALGAAVWATLVVFALTTAESLLARPLRNALSPFTSLLAAAFSLALLFVLARAIPLLLTRRGRQHFLAVTGRLLHHEYWPAWVFYAPLIPYTWYLGIKHKGYGVPTCVNPAIENGGGWVGESKFAILQHFIHANLLTTPGSPTPGILPTFFVPAGASPRERALAARDLMRRERLTFPIVLKPDQAQRGHAFKIARHDADLDDYFTSMTADAILQVFHPGPHECGILWIRHSRPTIASAGFNYSITRKEFPTLTGDGVHTLEELIHDHPRFRKQAPVFLDRFADELFRIPAAGEHIRLAMSGNHCQGTLFRDGYDLDSKELLASIERLALAFPDLDFGRFDIRYESDERLRAGTHFAVVELNGATSEPTSMYDPSRSPLFAYRVLLGLWTHIYALGAARRDAGVRPISLWRILKLTRQHANHRRGSALAD